MFRELLLIKEVKFVYVNFKETLVFMIIKVIWENVLFLMIMVMLSIKMINFIIIIY